MIIRRPATKPHPHLPIPACPINGRSAGAEQLLLWGKAHQLIFRLMRGRTLLTRSGVACELTVHSTADRHSEPPPPPPQS